MSLADRGHEVHFISYSVPFRLRQFHPNVFFHEVEVSAYPLFKFPPYDLALATRMAEVAKECQLEVLHAHYAVPHAVSAYLAKKMLRTESLKVVTTLHGTDITLVGADKSFFQVIQFSIEESDGVTAVSQYLKRRTIEEFNIRRDIRVIPNFIDTERFSGKSSACDRGKYARDDEKILFHASNFRPIKRVDDVVRIFAKVREQIPSKLILVGDGPERIYVQQLVRELKLTQHVHFLGEQDYVEHLLSNADLFLIPSGQESFGLVALEAMSSGVPVIGARIGGLPEVVAEGETGFLFPVGEVQSMADKAIELLSDRERHLQFKRAARERAVRLFDARLIIPKYEEYYREVLGQG